MTANTLKQQSIKHILRIDNSMSIAVRQRSFIRLMTVILKPYKLTCSSFSYKFLSKKQEFTFGTSVNVIYWWSPSVNPEILVEWGDLRAFNLALLSLARSSSLLARTIYHPHSSFLDGFNTDLKFMLESECTCLRAYRFYILLLEFTS